MNKKVVLVVMDGVGLSENENGNAVAAAYKPTLDAFTSSCPWTAIKAHGTAVGLPTDDDMGNSEVGHNALGCGQVYSQGAKLVNESIESGSMYTSDIWKKLVANCAENGSTMHFLGLLSDGNVHSHINHLLDMLTRAKKDGVRKCRVHILLDGRDVPATSGMTYIKELEDKMSEIGVGKIATLMGRFYAMDRDNMWDRVGMAYRAMVNGEGVYNSNAVDAVEKSYETIDGDGKHLTDEFVMPTVCSEDGKIKENDSVVFFNFRPDRAREITRAFVDPEFKGFERKYFPLYYVCMTQYDETMPNVKVAFAPEALKNTMGEYLSSLGKTQLRIAETQKYAHVTFFFNGGEEKVYPGEDRVLIDSPKISTFDLKPEMSAYEVCDAACERILSGKYDVVILNYANCDMVGHTGVFPAAVKAVETVDECVGKLVDAVNKMGGVTLITADHGNADKMYAEDGTPFTAHTTNPVPLIVVGYDCKLKQNGGRLCDLAPTMLDIMGLAKPAEMTGVSLIEK